MPSIAIAPATEEARGLWQKALQIAELLGDSRWTLIGGLMVQLHGFEHGGRIRPTTDIDLLGDSRRPNPAMPRQIAEALNEQGARMAMPPRGNANLGYQFELDGQIVEVLGSDGVTEDPPTLGKRSTFQVPGGSQALSRTERVGVSLDGGTVVRVPRPDLLGAVLIKARVVKKKRRDKFASDRQDLLRLLGFVADPRKLAEEGGLKKTERKWLRDIEAELSFHDPELEDLFARDEVQRSEQAYRLLLSEDE